MCFYSSLVFAKSFDMSSNFQANEGQRTVPCLHSGSDGKCSYCTPNMCVNHSTLLMSALTPRTPRTRTCLSVTVCHVTFVVLTAYLKQLHNNKRITRIKVDSFPIKHDFGVCCGWKTSHDGAVKRHCWLYSCNGSLVTSYETGACCISKHVRNKTPVLFHCWLNGVIITGK